MQNSGNVAIIGSGLVGASWALVFARAGYDVKLFDREREAYDAALKACRQWTGQLEERSLLNGPANVLLDRIAIADSLEAAIEGASYVQESVREDLEIKIAVSAQIAAVLPDQVCVGSSTSGFPASAFTEALPNRDRFLVVHPVNPPHLVPVVEIVPAPWTDASAVDTVCDLMQQIGQKPVLLNKEIDGFILNRLQGALLDEALRLYAGGYASLADIDATVSHGLGQRWSLIGPFETIDLNSSQRLLGYAHHLAPMYRRIAATKPDFDPWAEEVIERAHLDRLVLLPEADRANRQKWRDDMLMRMTALANLPALRKPQDSA